MAVVRKGLVSRPGCTPHNIVHPPTDKRAGRIYDERQAMLLRKIVETSQLVSQSSSRLAKIERLAECLKQLDPGEISIAVSYLCGRLVQGKVRLGVSMLRDASGKACAQPPSLELVEVHETFEKIGRIQGPGSTRQRAQLLVALFGRATEAERDFLRRLILGEMRQGALEGVVLEAIAKGSGVPSRTVRRAFNLSGNLGSVATRAFSEGEAGLSAFGITLGRPILPALAQTSENVGSALSQVGAGALEYKMDGARVQVHKSGRDVAVFTRRLNDVSDAVPELVEGLRTLPVPDVILDGEVLAFMGDGRPHAFQTTMRRFGRRLEVERLRKELPLTPYFFDCLYREGEALIDAAQSERAAALEAIVPASLLMPRIVTESPIEGERFFDAALAAGHEGIMVKALAAPYEAGERGKNWLKVKQTRSLDLVILAAEWGHGRRRGWLSNLHLGARDPSNNSFVMLGKTFKGLTDAMLEEQTRCLQRIAIHSDRHTVYVRPEVVVEIAFSDLQASPHYPAGLALRFARVKRYRPDKRADQADTVETARAIFEAQRTEYCFGNQERPRPNRFP